MKELRRKLAIFFYQNNSRGIPNLMLYVAIGNVIVWLFSMVDSTNVLYSVLCFNRSSILHGQIWRLFTYIFTYILDDTGFSLIMGMISLLCYYYIGHSLEQYWGTLRFNCYYLSGIILTDIVGLLSGAQTDMTYINLSLFLAIATIVPDTRFLVMYIIPIKARYLAWVEIGFVLFGTFGRLSLLFTYGLSFSLLLYALSPLISLLNYILFFGSDIANLLPESMRHRSSKTQRNFRAQQRPNPEWSRNYQSSTGEKPYRHKCTVCGRTDITNPELEFRYCSKCVGFHCYCQDHINSHVHIQES